MKTLKILPVLLLIPLFTWAQKSHTLFTDNNYQPDSVVVCGQILGRTDKIAPSIHMNHFITDEAISIPIPIDSLGKFSIKIPVFNTTDIDIWAVGYGVNIKLFAEPGERIIIHSDWIKDKVTFEGERAKDHQDVFDFDSFQRNLSPDYHFAATDYSGSHDAFLEKQKILSLRQDSVLEDYIIQHPGFSLKAKQEIEIRKINSFAFSLIQRKFLLNRTEGEKFSKNYITYVDSIFNALPQPYSIIDNIILTNYINYYNEIQQTPPAYTQAVIDYAIKEKRIKPTKEQLKNPILLLQSKEFAPIISETFEELMQTDYLTRILADYYTKEAFTRPMPPRLREIIVTRFYYSYLSKTRTAFPKAHIERFKQVVKNEYLKDFVLSYQQKLANLAASQIVYSESLKDATLLKDCKTGEEIFSQLIAPHKGKIIYMDIWGTWCAPCKKELTYVAPIKEAMKDKDIVFIYLANGSPDIAWKNVIKENQLTGKQSEHYKLPTAQQRQLEQFLDVHYYPSYIIIDKEGKIVEKKALRPSSGEQLINYLNELFSR